MKEFSFLILILYVQNNIRGHDALICLSCADVIQPRHCHVIAYCAADEECLVERHLAPDGLRYSTGCVKRQTCGHNSTSKVQGPSTNSLYCSECCNSDFCNSEGCGQPGYPQDHGPICFNCKQERHSQDCRSIAYCRNSEVCQIQEDIEFGDNVFSYSCIPAQYCKSITPREGSIASLSNTHNFTYAPNSHGNPVPTGSGISHGPSLIRSTLSPDHTTNFSQHVQGIIIGKRNGLGNAKDLDEGQRSQVGKRYTQCSECCSGDLCNFMCNVRASPSPPSSTVSLYNNFTTPLSGGYTQNTTKTTFMPVVSTPVVLQTTSKNPFSKISTSHFSVSTTDSVYVDMTSTLVYPANQGLHQIGTVGQKFLLLFTRHDNKEEADNVTLLVTSEQEGNISIFDPQTKVCFNTTVSMGSNIIDVNPKNTILPMTIAKKGILVTSDVDVSIHVMEYRNVADSAYLALPVNVLSTQYIAASYPAISLFNPSHVTVGAVDNDTHVNFVLSDNTTIIYQGRTYGSGDALNVTLDSLDTFQLASNSDLSGVKVQSDKPISVLSGTTFTTVPSPTNGQIFDAQTLEQMIPPVSGLGKHFIVPPIQDNAVFHVRVISAFDNTDVDLNGIQYHLQSAGEFVEMKFQTDTPVNVSSNKPVLAVEYSETKNSLNSHSSGAMMLIPAVSQYLPVYNFTVPDPPKRNYQTTYRHYVSIMIPGNDIGSLIIDDKPYWMYNGNINTIQLNGKYYSVISRAVSPGFHSIRSTTNVPFGLMTYGFDYAQGYGYPVQMRLPTTTSHKRMWI